jgi:perosamine synthetase
VARPAAATPGPAPRHEPGPRQIGLSAPWLDEREEELVVEVMRSGRLSLGPTIDEFEEAFAAAVGAPFAAAVSSGTAGLHLLCVAAGIQDGDEVITSPYSFVASANCAIYEGATPVFADIDGRTLNLDPAAVESAITSRTRAVVGVDIFGYPSELDELQDICARHEIALIDDACEALGAAYKGRPVGAQGQDAVFAFYPNKQITTGEGGVVTTWSEETWRLLKSLRNQGRADGGGWLDHARLGFNYRIDDIRAAIGLGQLEKLDLILSHRRAVALRYNELLSGIDGLELPCPDDAEHHRSWFVYVVTLPDGTDREAVIATLESRGVQTARYLPCIHLQSYMRERYGFREGLCPVAEGVSRRTLALPFHARLDTGDQQLVAETLRSALQG